MTEDVQFQRYHPVQRALHWLLAFALIGQGIFGLYMVSMANSPQKIEFYNLHKSIGLTILVLVILRLVWRWRHPPPPLPAGMPAWERLAARASHVLLYCLMLAMPASGLVIGFASGFPTVVYGLFNLPSPIEANEELMHFMSSLHFYLATALLLLVLVHAAAALRHHFLLKDTVLRRMLPALAGGLLSIGVLLPGTVQATEWQTDYEQSRLAFIGSQSGDEFEGVFEEFDAAIIFDLEDLDNASVEVTIETASVNSGSGQRDSSIRDEGLLHVERYPQARFVAESFREIGEGQYEAEGALTLRDTTRDVVLPFSLEIEGEGKDRQARAEGELAINRLDYGVGQGQWEDTSQVGAEIVIHFVLHAEATGS
ncbi:cytochrome b/b6 domain-containing protein [Fodinicurvata fenggangensis]|uniref:cytochrome b/b6 domain-containing protein n=1 Tax=Fodinicurvata fenggangensis TaxID=1121830 RepID=UPI0012DC46E5|nr:cytochrome b/b6 domain-containing protein [Fodinicurvata fenggangensis]